MRGINQNLEQLPCVPSNIKFMNDHKEIHIQGSKSSLTSLSENHKAK